ncbi:MAG: NADH-quinone oxidoreductase subunit A [Alphaproteobacteria bacterium]|nr:NADH-quinone oxidoreductase subunit A [Alphaproteobacteria bacterium]
MQQNVAQSATNYLPILLLIICVFAFVGAMIFISSILGPKRNTADKLKPFTSGIPTHGDAREQMPVKFFLIAILFVLFDVEVVFFYPYAVNFKMLGWFGFIEVLIFVAIFLVGYFYIIKNKAIEWQD